MTEEKTLLSLSDEDKAVAEKWLNKPVLCSDNGKVGLLVAIYEDVYETTAGFSSQIDVHRNYIYGLVTFNADYATYLPVEWKKMKWKFPTGEVGDMEVDFNSNCPYVSGKGFQHAWVVSTKPLVEEK